MEETQQYRYIDREPNVNFQPKVGMIINPTMGNGYTGVIEVVGEDYFVLRCGRTKGPVLIKPFQYPNLILSSED